MPVGKASGSTSSQEFSGSDIISRQAVLCHRILRSLEATCEDHTNIVDRESWDAILIFLLAINDSLLSVPTERDDIGTNLCQRIVSSLFVVWLNACHRCFPTPSFWKTFHELCIKLRHRHDVVDQWSLTCIALTQRLVQLSQSAQAAPVAPSPLPATGLAVLMDMDYDVVSQTWFRFLHLIGNPVELSIPSSIAKSLRETGSPAINGMESGVESKQHPCLNDLPENFKRAMKGISSLVNSFLGVPVHDDRSESPADSSISPSVPRRPNNRPASKGPLTVVKQQLSNRNSHGVNLAPTLPADGQPYLPVPSTTTPQPTASSDSKIFSSRPKVNSVLNILGNWLFSASLIGSDMSDANELVALRREHSNSSSSLNTADIRRSSNSDRTSFHDSSSLSSEHFEAGQGSNSSD